MTAPTWFGAAAPYVISDRPTAPGGVRCAIPLHTHQHAVGKRSLLIADCCCKQCGMPRASSSATCNGTTVVGMVARQMQGCCPCIAELSVLDLLLITAPAASQAADAGHARCQLSQLQALASSRSRPKLSSPSVLEPLVQLLRCLGDVPPLQVLRTASPLMPPAHNKEPGQRSGLSRASAQKVVQGGLVEATASCMGEQSTACCPATQARCSLVHCIYSTDCTSGLTSSSLRQRVKRGINRPCLWQALMLCRGLPGWHLACIIVGE